MFHITPVSTNEIDEHISKASTITKDEGTIKLIVKGHTVMQRCFKGTAMKNQLKESWTKMWALRKHPTAEFVIVKHRVQRS